MQVNVISYKECGVHFHIKSRKPKSGPGLRFALSQTPILKNPNPICIHDELRRDGLSVQNIMTITSSIVNTIGRSEMRV